jgi:hypothetical protein
MSAWVYPAVGLMAGTHTATWGMYKDAVHEGFTWRTYLRSIVVSLVLSLCVGASGLLPIDDAGDVVVLFGLVYVLERAVTEFYKTFIRDEDQSKYFIPMQFHVLGRVVRDRRVRLGVGLAALGAAVGLLGLVRSIQVETAGPARGATILLVGSVGGWFSAFGGAFKDAPIEGFETFKFFRSPLFAGGYAMLLANFTSSWVIMTLAALGYVVATLETWKTFFFPTKPRGKFAGKPILFPELLRKRQRVLPLYFGIWLVLLVGIGLALAGV